MHSGYGSWKLGAYAGACSVFCCCRCLDMVISTVVCDLGPISSTRLCVAAGEKSTNGLISKFVQFSVGQFGLLHIENTYMHISV